jgi:hypothetical protein
MNSTQSECRNNCLYGEFASPAKMEGTQFFMYSVRYFCQTVTDLGFSPQILTKVPDSKFRGHSCRGSQKDRHYEANTPFSLARARAFKRHSVLLKDR